MRLLMDRYLCPVIEHKSPIPIPQTSSCYFGLLELGLVALSIGFLLTVTRQSDSAAASTLQGCRLRLERAKVMIIFIFWNR